MQTRDWRPADTGKRGRWIDSPDADILRPREQTLFEKNVNRAVDLLRAAYQAGRWKPTNHRYPADLLEMFGCIVMRESESKLRELGAL